ncbi:MAG: hypothetical protein NT013_18265 [Planctomycetia bacterium]|nr:hypothetical protein [Planctomycetia bacterium]
MSEPVVDHNRESNDISLDTPREFSGAKVIIGLFVFAFVMSFVLWVYWSLHTGPFLPLQRAIFREFPKSYPHVEGGQRRMHKNTPKTLRVTMRVAFDPESVAEKPQVEAVFAQLVELAKKNIAFETFELFEVHFVLMRPEHSAKKLTVTRDVAPLLNVNAPEKSDWNEPPNS